MSAPHVLIVGAGTLGSALALGLSLQSRSKALKLTIGSRDIRRAAWAARIAQAHADSAGSPLLTEALELKWEYDSLSRMLASVNPTVVVLAASPQSAWPLQIESEWSKLVHHCGYALTAALQLQSALLLQKSLSAAGKETIFVNACYPDLLNALLCQRQPAPICGIGNAAIIAEGLRQHLVPSGRLRLLAGHADVTLFCKAPSERKDLPPVWIDEKRVDDVCVQSMEPLVNLPSLNLLNAAPSARLLSALAFDEMFEGHVPGPLGLVGGYPVKISGSHLSLDLPVGMTREDAVDWNRQRSWTDGGSSFEDGSGVMFSENVCEALKPLLPEFAVGFQLDNAKQAGDAFYALRTRLGG